MNFYVSKGVVKFASLVLKCLMFSMHSLRDVHEMTTHRADHVSLYILLFTQLNLIIPGETG
jgi:hypothetical protein